MRRPLLPLRPDDQAARTVTTTKLTDRDRYILAKCAVCRWLSTSQIQRIYFQKASLNAVQKRLRKLSDEGYLRSYRENQMAEVLHAVGPKGKPILEEEGIDIGASDPPKQLDHLAGINTVRIALETSTLPLAYFFAYWQLSSIGWTFPVIPDAVFALGGPERRRFLVEYDRGTEPLKTIVEKLRNYNRGIPGFVPDGVLLVFEENRQIDRLGRELRKTGNKPRCFMARASDFEQTVTGNVFTDILDGTQTMLVEL